MAFVQFQRYARRAGRFGLGSSVEMWLTRHCNVAQEVGLKLDVLLLFVAFQSSHLHSTTNCFAWSLLWNSLLMKRVVSCYIWHALPCALWETTSELALKGDCCAASM